ncbi:MAG TPA: carbohydrate kinase family protein [Pseudonocardiaceae bacterium]|nr:carbohydrate kinase family protein [Pseudonocardiaceae bacterium]
MGNADRVLVVGDAMIDALGAADQVTADEVCRAGHVLGALHLQPGGAGLIAAAAARDAGAVEVALWTSVGADVGAEIIRSRLRQLGVVDLLHTDPERGTGTVVCVQLKDGQRFMLADPGANSNAGSVPDRVQDFARTCGVLYVSGYVLQSPDRASRVEGLIDVCRGRGGTVVLDLVPHRIECLVPRLRRVLDRTDVLVGEEPTFRKVFDQSGAAPGDVAQLAAYVTTRHRMALIRHTNDSELLATAGGDRVWFDTGFSGAAADQQAGFLDRRAMHVLLARLRRAG